MSKNNTAYRNSNWVFIAWNSELVSWLYWQEKFNDLSLIKEQQENISSLMDVLWNFNGVSYNKKKQEVKAKLAEDEKKIETINIIESSDTKPLIEMKKWIKELIVKNIMKYSEIEKIEYTSNLKKNIEELKILVGEVSGENIKNLRLKYTSSEQFRTKIIDRIKNIKVELSILQKDNSGEYSDVENEVSNLFKEANNLYWYLVDGESVRNKSEAAGVNLEDILTQMFWRKPF